MVIDPTTADQCGQNPVVICGQPFLVPECVFTGAILQLVGGLEGLLADLLACIYTQRVLGFLSDSCQQIFLVKCPL